MAKQKVKSKVCKQCLKRLSIDHFQYRPESDIYRGKCQSCMYKNRRPRDKKQMAMYKTLSDQLKKLKK